MSLSAKSIGLGIIFGLIFGMVIGSFIQLSGIDQSPLQEEIVRLESQISTLEAQIASQTNQISSQTTQITNQTAQIANLQQEVNHLKSQLPDPPPSEGEPGSSRFFPAVIGDTLTCTFEYWSENYTAKVSVVEIIRGADAWTLIEERNMFNDPPPTGSEYIMIKINFTYVSGPTIDTTYDVYEARFDVISNEGYEYDLPSIVDPEPDIDATLYPGASHEGWGVYQVYINDTAPVFTFGREYSGEGGIWFKVYE